MKVLMVPNPHQLGKGESGIHTVVRKYAEHMPAFGVEYVGESDECDLLHVHAGMGPAKPGVPVVASLHGLYWTADYRALRAEHVANKNVVSSIRVATEITVPSAWVAETIARDMRLMPHIVPHGVDAAEWATDGSHDGYVVAYAKNRMGIDVSMPGSATRLARALPNVNFVATFSEGTPPPNMKTLGVLPYATMKNVVKRAAVFVSPVKETFGIGPLEAMAAGVPVLTVNVGSVPDLVQHGVGGYCYKAGDMEDMLRGLEYCLKNRDVLGRNAAHLARAYTWQDAAAKMYAVYEAALIPRPPTVDVIIPVYNKELKDVERAIRSALVQTRRPGNIFVVDDGSDNGDGIAELCRRLKREHGGRGTDIRYLRQDNRGVAHARNLGISHSTATFVTCLDADDAIEQGFLEACVGTLESNPDVWVAYTKLRYIDGNKTGVSKWPGEWNYDEFLRRKNQVPTCCVYRRELWERLGGYHQRYAPQGAGAEDAEFFLRAGAHGYGGRLATDEPLFVYTMGQGVTSQEGYSEVDWLAWHKPWLQGDHPFASYATPANNIAHPVRQYDEPVISVVIPVGPGHEDMVHKALDSLEAQTFLKWEAVVVADGFDVPERLRKAYPYARFVRTTENGGAGAARNLGVTYTRGQFLVFLDADDWLLPEYMERAIETWNETGYGVYTDYIGKAMVGDISALDPQLRRNVLHYDGKEAIIGFRAADYDCQRAIRQPEDKPYIWGNVTMLIPKEWHKEAGGFDESLPSWEDADLSWRLARLGKCFVRVPEQLMVYRFYTGTRREIGLEMGVGLIRQLRQKYEQIGQVKMCGCNKQAPAPRPGLNQVLSSGNGAGIMANVNDENIVVVRYKHPNTGQHPVVGAATKTFYGYRGGGEQFLVDRRDAEAQPQYFEVVTNNVVSYDADAEEELLPEPEPLPEVAVETARVAEEAVEAAPEAEEEPVATRDWEINASTMSVDYTDDILDLSGLNLPKRSVNALERRGIITPEQVLELGVDALTNIKWVSRSIAELVYAEARKQAGIID
jgi:glycosyltransferase involved in cell wall biosynthesis